jgi:hypothetical protein
MKEFWTTSDGGSWVALAEVLPESLKILNDLRPVGRALAAFQLLV